MFRGQDVSGVLPVLFKSKGETEVEIQINRKLIFAIIALAVLVAAAIGLRPLLATTNLPALPGAPASSSTPLMAGSPELAAVKFVQAFYAADYRAPDAWLANLKPLATADGYILLKDSFGPALWVKLTEAQTVTLAAQVKAEDGGLVTEGVSKIGGPWQVRKVMVTMEAGALWPTMKEPSFSANILLGQQEGEWRFVSFLNDKEIETLAKGEPGA
jgi:hypothetical protein